MKNMNVFELAHKELEREGKIEDKYYFSLLLDKAEKIVDYLDDIEEKKEKTRFKKVLQPV